MGGLKALREAIEWVLRRLDIDPSQFRGVVATVVVIVLIALIVGIVIAAFLMFLARRASQLIFGEFVKNVKFIPVVDMLIIVTTTAPVWLSTKSLLFAALAGVGAILTVVKEQAKLREVQEERRKHRPSETLAP